MLLGRSLTYVLSAFSIGNGKENLDKPQENGITWVTRNWQVNRDQPFTIEWDGHEGPVSVTLVRRAEGKWQSLWKVACQYHPIFAVHWLMVTSRQHREFSGLPCTRVSL